MEIICLTTTIRVLYGNFQSNNSYQGVVFHSVEMVQDLMAKAKTRTGLTVFTTLLDKVYETGRKVTQGFKETMEIVFDEHLPK
ncbi:ISAzo13-like element transposase-related protein [Leptolyngbya sp. FACHB-261]|uniref:ISAzo13-like element transposase-related protein n=1 Tax=Leptolyngbya sp. FACHB-261 TaxID=2692806 RepID=UPI0016892817|nr:hypothetical protein [Leptolyngbya sp. FACHB-261]MBD2101605.1 hypothetical protein [Leptolyngbya sp. FACHB-261]